MSLIICHFTLICLVSRFAIDRMQSVCLDEFGGEKTVDTRTQETTLIQYIFGGRLQSQVGFSVAAFFSKYSLSSHKTMAYLVQYLNRNISLPNTS